MPPDGRLADVIVGIQWGDEGKGRVVDAYAGRYDIVARFGGGDNAGHTIIVGDRKLALRIVPSGVLQERPALFVGGGTVVSLSGLIDELEMLAAIGVDVGRIKISDRAHLVLPYHVEADNANERARGALPIGTTGRGIGPAYTDKVARMGITFGEVRRPNALAETIRRTIALKRNLTTYGSSIDEDAVVAHTLELGRRVAAHVVDGVAYIHDALESGKRVLIEGAQGSLLDVGYGTYPYVTSSHTIAGGACIGLGIGPRAIGAVVGVAKAYCTRVGSGPLPSELDGAVADHLRARGAEFGTVTGRPRRCGWFDAVAARYAARINGLTSVVVTKLDVLTGLERIGIVERYECAGEPVGMEAAADPRLQTRIAWFDGWRDDLSRVVRIEDLPANARRYVAALEASFSVPVEAVSVGPERSALAAAS